MIGNPEDVHHSALEVDDEQRTELVNLMVSTTKKSVARCHRPRRVELLPGRSTVWSGPRPRPRATRWIQLAEMRHPEPVPLAQYTSPSAVLPAESDDELDDLDRRAGDVLGPRWAR